MYFRFGAQLVFPHLKAQDGAAQILKGLEEAEGFEISTRFVPGVGRRFDIKKWGQPSYENVSAFLRLCTAYMLMDKAACKDLATHARTAYRIYTGTDVGFEQLVPEVMRNALESA
ncbi:hypothetical protein F5Y17DRAFT_417776 [Xylariaceae sp. FL0594]|nr:hypothetical protein F5Y17DRAFT_417776 [Xylariaceae sp. FL0594]